MMKAVSRVFVFATFVLLAACGGDRLSDAEYIQNAQEFMDKGELQSAAIELKNALQQNPDNPQARRLLGIVHFDAGNMAGAEKELRRAAELGVADDAVMPVLARALLSQRKFEDLYALSLNKLAPGATRAEVLSAQGLGKLKQRNTEEAQKLIDEALAQAEDSIYAGEAKAQLLAAQNDYEAAFKELDRVLGLDPGFASAWSFLGGLQQSQEQFADAEESYTKAIDNSRVHMIELINRAMVRIRLNKYEAAQKDVDLLLKRAPKNPAANFAQGLIHIHNDKLQAAKGSFELSLEANSRQLLPKYYLALVNLRLGNIEQADDYAEQALAASPASIAIRKLAAEIKLKKREFKQVEELVRPILAAREEDAEAVRLMASALMGQNEPDQALPLWEKLAALQPDSAEAELQLGAVLLATGNKEEGVARIENALAKDQGLSLARILLVRHYVDERNLEKAMQAAQAYRASEPDSPAPLNLIGDLLQRMGDEKQAIEFYNKALALAPGDRPANFTLAALAAKDKQYGKARDYYLDVLAHHENDLDALLRLIAIDIAENDESQMVSHLNQAISAHPRAVRPRVILAHYHLLKGEEGKVAPLMVELNRRDKENSAVLEVMAQAQLRQKEYREAEFNLKKLIERRPDDAQLRYLMARTQAGLGDAEAMQRELRKVVALSPEHVEARLALARLAMRQNRKGEMQNQVTVLEKLAPENADVKYLMSALASAEGDQQQAKGLLEEVFAEVPNVKTMLLLARQKWAMGDPEGALAVQQQWAKEHPDDPLASLVLARAYGRENEQAKAIAQYEKVLQKDADNVIALNDLAWNLRDKQPAKALEYAQRANQLAPKSPQVLDTLAMVQLSNGQVEQASRSIERALQKAPDNRSSRYHSAMIAEASGDTLEATTILSELLADPAGFPEREEAEQMLQRLRTN